MRDLPLSLYRPQTCARTRTHTRASSKLRHPLRSSFGIQCRIDLLQQLLCPAGGGGCHNGWCLTDRQHSWNSLSFGWCLLCRQTFLVVFRSFHNAGEWCSQQTCFTSSVVGILIILLRGRHQSDKKRTSNVPVDVYNLKGTINQKHTRTLRHTYIPAESNRAQQATFVHVPINACVGSMQTMETLR